MHRTHHTAQYVNVLLNFRISPFWILVGGLGWVFSLAIYLGQAQAAGLAIVIFTFWGIFTYSAFRWDDAKIGRASCRERVCLYVELSVVAVSLHIKSKSIMYH